jgi:hypothetical protein
MSRVCLLLVAALLLGSACDDGFGDSLDDVTLADPALPVAMPANGTSAPSERPSPDDPDSDHDDASAARTVTFPTSGRLALGDQAEWFTLHVDADVAAISATLAPSENSCSSTAAFELALYAADGTTLAAYQRRAGCARLQVAALAAGDYYLRVSASRATRFTLDANVTP